MQLSFAEELLEVHLVAASRELSSTSTAPGTDANGSGQDLKLRLGALVKQITACFVGVQSCLPEPQSPATARPSKGHALTTPVQVPTYRHPIAAPVITPRVVKCTLSLSGLNLLICG